MISQNPIPVFKFVSSRICHQLRHPLRMRPVDVAVGIEDQFSAVAVPLPLGNHLHVDPFLDCACNEHSPEGDVRVVWQLQAGAGAGQRLL